MRLGFPVIVILSRITILGYIWLVVAKEPIFGGPSLATFLHIWPLVGKGDIEENKQLLRTVARFFTFLYIEMLVIKPRGRKTTSRKSIDVLGGSK